MTATRQVAIVTGASSGLGEAFARAIAADPALAEVAEIWLVARRGARLEALAQALPRGLGVPIVADLATPAGQELVLARAREQRPAVRLFVGNAGVGYLGSFAAQESESLTNLLNLNIGAISRLTHGLLPWMPRGANLVLVASAAGYVPSPYFAAYAASKSFVISLAYALRHELRPRAIDVCVVCPGPVTTEFFARAGQVGPISARASAPERVATRACATPWPGGPYRTTASPRAWWRCSLAPHRGGPWPGWRRAATSGARPRPLAPAASVMIRDPVTP